jgi:hypothetical protein
VHSVISACINGARALNEAQTSHIGKKAEHVKAAASIHIPLTRFALNTCAGPDLIVQKLMVAEVWTDRVKLRKVHASQIYHMCKARLWISSEQGLFQMFLQLVAHVQAMKTEMAGLADWWCQNGTPFSAWWSATSIGL